MHVLIRASCKFDEIVKYFVCGDGLVSKTAGRPLTARSTACVKVSGTARPADDAVDAAVTAPEPEIRWLALVVLLAPNVVGHGDAKGRPALRF